jgi:GTP-binding protein
VRYLTKTLRDTFPFSEVAIKVVLRAKGERKNREPDTDVIEVPNLFGGEDETQILRSPKEHSHPAPLPPEDEPDQRPRKKPRGSETWDF